MKVPESKLINGQPGSLRFRLAWDTVAVMVERFAITSIEGQKKGRWGTGSLNACSTVGSKLGHQVGRAAGGRTRNTKVMKILIPGAFTE